MPVIQRFECFGNFGRFPIGIESVQHLLKNENKRENLAKQQEYPVRTLGISFFMLGSLVSFLALDGKTASAG
jgi:hypothetical protein